MQHNITLLDIVVVPYITWIHHTRWYDEHVYREEVEKAQQVGIKILFLENENDKC